MNSRPSAPSVQGEIKVDIENPAGILSTTVVAWMAGDALRIASAAYQRSAQVLLKGYVPLYAASPALRAALARRAE